MFKFVEGYVPPIMNEDQSTCPYCRSTEQKKSIKLVSVDGVPCEIPTYLHLSEKAYKQIEAFALDAKKTK